MRYKDLIEALQEPDWDTIKSWAKLYGKKHGINPNYILGLFNHESMVNDKYHSVGDQTFLQDIKDKWKNTKTPERWKDNPYVKAYGEEDEAHMSYGPGHFSVRALTKVQNKHPEFKGITWKNLKANHELAAELSVIHFRDLYNDSANKGSSERERVLNAYTAKKGSYRGLDPNSPRIGEQFMASINKYVKKPFAVATASTDQGWLSKWADEDESKKKWLAGQEKVKQKRDEFLTKLNDPDEWNKAITSTMNTLGDFEKGSEYHKVPKGYYYDTGGNLVKIDPSKEMTWSDWADPSDETTTWNPQTWFPNWGGGPESEEGRNKRIAALNKKKQDAFVKKTASQSSKTAGPKTPRSIKPSNTKP